MRLIDADKLLSTIDNPVQYRTLKRLLDEAETVECKGDAISRQGLKESLLSEDYEKHEYCFPCKEIMKRIDGQPSAQPEQRWIPCSKEPDTDRNVFIARGKPDFMTVCIGYYDHNYKQW